MNGATNGRSQRGAATLWFSLVLMMAMALAAYFANRNMAVEQRLAANQVLAAQAFEAAEAGLEWATSQLNNTQRLGDNCQASDAASAQSFRSRRVVFEASTGMHTPRTWLQGGTAQALQAVCIRKPQVATGWDCSCPISGHPSVSVSIENTQAFTPAFVVTLMPASTPGQVRVIAQVCTSYSGICRPGTPTTGNKAEATAQVQHLLALVGGVASAPAAALTVVGNVSTHAVIGLHTGSAGSAAVQAGGVVQAPNARIGTAAGGVASLAVIEQDQGLSQLSEAGFFNQLFGVDAATWTAQSVVQKLTCQADCAAALSDAMAATDGPLLLWTEGDLTLSGPLVLGSAARPVLLVVGGNARVSGQVQIHGLLHAARVEWMADGTGAGRVTGAVTSASHYLGNGAPDLVHDAAVLKTLRANSGSFARVAGSWKDF